MKRAALVRRCRPAIGPCDLDRGGTRRRCHPAARHWVLFRLRQSVHRERRRWLALGPAARKRKRPRRPGRSEEPAEPMGDFGRRREKPMGRLQAHLHHAYASGRAGATGGMVGLAGRETAMQHEPRDCLGLGRMRKEIGRVPCSDETRPSGFPRLAVLAVRVRKLAMRTNGSAYGVIPTPSTSLGGVSLGPPKVHEAGTHQAQARWSIARPNCSKE